MAGCCVSCCTVCAEVRVAVDERSWFVSAHMSSPSACSSMMRSGIANAWADGSVLQGQLPAATTRHAAPTTVIWLCAAARRASQLGKRWRTPAAGQCWVQQSSVRGLGRSQGSPAGRGRRAWPMTAGRPLPCSRHRCCADVESEALQLRRLSVAAQPVPQTCLGRSPPYTNVPAFRSTD